MDQWTEGMIMDDSKNYLEVATPQDKWGDHKALIDILPDSKLRNRMLEVASEISRGRTEREFNYLLKEDEDYPVARRLRHQFWNVFNNAMTLNKTKFNITAVYRGLISQQKFNKLLDCDIKTAFILTPPFDIKSIQGDLLYEGYRHLDEIMQMPVTDSRGAPDHKAIATKIQIIKMMEDRIHGSVVQREQKYIESLNAESPVSSKEKMEELKAEVEKLRIDLGKASVEDAEFKDIDE